MPIVYFVLLQHFQICCCCLEIKLLANYLIIANVRQENSSKIWYVS
jgi:hypothetical protein